MQTRWLDLINRPIASRPTIRIRSHGTPCNKLVYITVFWQPEQRLGIMRASEWHTTLIRFATEQSEILDIVLGEMERDLSTFLTLLDGPSHELVLTTSPWQQSWTFGLGSGTADLCQALRLCAKRLITTRLAIEIGPERPLHLCWQ